MPLIFLLGKLHTEYSLNFGNSPGFFKFFSIKLYLTCEVV